MEYSQHFSLQHFTTFKTPGFASHFFPFKNEEELTTIVQRNDFERISNHYKDISLFVFTLVTTFFNP